MCLVSDIKMPNEEGVAHSKGRYDPSAWRPHTGVLAADHHDDAEDGLARAPIFALEESATAPGRTPVVGLASRS